MISVDDGSGRPFPPLLHLSFILQQLADELLLAETGISVSQVRILSALNVTRPSLQNQVALNLRQTEANVSRQLRVMKAKGLVTIEKNKKDGRARDVRLTAKGSAAYEKAAAVLEHNMDSLIHATGIRTADLF